MNQLVNLPTATMNSIQIADLVESEHHHVRISIERLVKKNLIQLPPMRKVENKQSTSPNRFTNAYEFLGETGKRDSIVVVAQLCPEFTARLVDRWQELEHQSTQHKIDLNNPQALRKALLEYTEQVIELEHKNLGLEQSIQTITQTPAGVKFQQACKILNIKRHILTEWLSKHGWDRRLNNTRASTYYSQERGYCETKYEEVVKVKTNGELGSYTRIEFFILPKGMQILVKHFGSAAA